MVRLAAAFAILLLALPASALPTLPEAPVAGLQINPAAGSYMVHRNPDVATRLNAIAEEFPELATVGSIGKTVLGQDIWSITLSAPNGTKAWRIYLDGGHHGNEFMGVEMVMLYLGHLVEGYRAQDPGVLAFLADHEVMAVPLVNADGNLLDTRKNARLVDLNRNYPYKWGGEGSSGEVADFTYRGPEPLSEPESRANWETGTAFAPHVWVTMHTGISEFYWPWGWTHDPSPDDAMFTQLEEPFEQASNGRVDAMQGAELYIVDGATDDSAYGLLGIPGFTYEVHDDQFQPAYPGGIGPALADQLAALVWFLEHTRHLGALVTTQARQEGSTLAVEVANSGWGEARNVTVNLTAAGATVASQVVTVPAGQTATVTFADAPEGVQVAARYPRLLVNSTPILETLAIPEVVPLGGVLPTPAPGVALAVFAVAAVGFALRRRA